MVLVDLIVIKLHTINCMSRDVLDERGRKPIGVPYAKNTQQDVEVGAA